MDSIVSWAKKNKTPLILTAIVIIGFLLRVATIDNYGGLWCDEAYSWWVSTLPFPSGIINELKAYDYHPPLYHFILHFWMKLFGDSDIVIKLLSIIFSTATVLVSYFIGEKLKDKNCGLICAALNAFLLFNLIHAQQVRFYVPSVTFAALSLLFTLKVFDEEKIMKPLIGLIVSNALLIYTLTAGIFFVAIENLVLLVFLIAYRKDTIKKFILSQLVTFFVCLPQIIFMFGQYLRSRGANPWRALFPDTSMIFNYIWNSFTWWNITNEKTYGIMGVFLSIALIVILFKIFYSRSKKFWLTCLVSGIYFLFVLITLHFKIMPLAFHYMGIFMLLFIIIISYLITEYKNPLSSILFLTVFLTEIYFGSLAYSEERHLSSFAKIEGYKMPATYLKNSGYDKNLLISMGWGERLIRYIDGDNIKLFKAGTDFVKETPVGGHFVIISGYGFKEKEKSEPGDWRLYDSVSREKRFKKVFMSEDLGEETWRHKYIGVFHIVIFQRIK